MTSGPKRPTYPSFPDDPGMTLVDRPTDRLLSIGTNPPTAGAIVLIPPIGKADMSTFRLRLAALVVLGGTLTSAIPAVAQERPAGQILADIKAVEMPKVPKNKNAPGAEQEFMAKRQKAAEQRAVLIGELYKGYPDSPEVPKLILERWQGAFMPGPKAAELKAEVDDVLARGKNQPLVAEAAFVDAIIGFRKLGQYADGDQMLTVAEKFLKRSPKDPRGAELLTLIASKMTDPAKADALTARVEKDFPNSPLVLQRTSEKRLKEAIGKPFAIEFNDAITGAPVSPKTLKGKVVILDFWATWCGPCVNEMPHMKELYAQYRDKGVEFIGVSLDSPKEEGGLDLLKAYVAKNKIEWPQYYQGNGWESEFSMSWGIQSIPAVFAIGADGNLASTQAGGKLDELIPELLAKAEKMKKSTTKP